MRDLAIAFVFFTRLPIRVDGDVSAADIARASRYYPLVGLAVGLWIGLVYATMGFFFPPLLAATLAALAGAIATGAFHEDALGDVADGFGGGFTRERKLEIMKDSRHGTYGVLAMVFALLLRVQAIAMLPLGLAVAAVAASHALSRTGIVWMLWRLPVARAEGLGADAHRLSWREPVMASILGLAIALTLVGPIWAAAAGLAAVLATLVVSKVSMRQVQGITGDVLGSAQQVAELFALLTLGVLVRHGAPLASGLAAWLP